jgi:hypothetical protein
MQCQYGYADAQPHAAISWRPERIAQVDQQPDQEAGGEQAQRGRRAMRQHQGDKPDQAGQHRLGIA